MGDLEGPGGSASLASPVSIAGEGGGYHLLKVETQLPGTPEEVFPFFADAENLERITPPDLSFEIATARPIEMETGTRIDYRLELNGLPFRWRTEITEWDPPHAFTDTQIRGPYHTWIHRHTFEPSRPVGADGGAATLMTDRVRFRLPLWPLGQVALPLVRRRLRRIFEFRGRAIRRLLPNGSDARGRGPGSGGARP